MMQIPRVGEVEVTKAIQNDHVVGFKGRIGTTKHQCMPLLPPLGRHATNPREEGMSPSLGERLKEA